MKALWRLGRSLIFRLALIYLLLFVLSVTALLGLAFWGGVARPLGVVRERVERESTVLARAYEREPRDVFVARLEARAAAADRRAAYYALLAPDGRVIAANLPVWPIARAKQDWVRFEFESYATGDEVEHETLARDVTFADGVRLLVGRDTEDLDEREDFLGETILWGAGLTLAIGLAGGLMMSLAIGRRLEAVARTAREVIGGDLAGRVPLRGSGDDFDNLAQTLNEMLSRIERLFQSVSRVSDSIAHELRTPLARLQADLDDLAKAARRSPAQRALVAQAQGEAARLQSVFDALLRIARIESGRHGAAMRPVALAGLLEDAVDFYRPEAEARGQSLDLSVPVDLAVNGDSDLIFQAMSNLLDNAIKYGPTGAGVSVQGRFDQGFVEIAVSDTGAGVPPGVEAKLGERFFRAPQHHDRPGVGLGLALVRAVAEMHGGEVAFNTGTGGFRATLRLRR